MKLSGERRVQPLKAAEAIRQAEAEEEVRPNEFYRTKVPEWIKKELEKPIRINPNDSMPLDRILLRSIVKKTVIPLGALKKFVVAEKKKNNHFIIQDSLEDNLADGVSESLAWDKQAQLMLGELDGINPGQLEKLRLVLGSENLINAEELQFDDRLRLMFDGAQLFPEFQSAYWVYLRAHVDEILADIQAKWEEDFDIPQDSGTGAWMGLNCFMILNQEHIGIDADGRIFLTPEMVHTTTSQDLPPRQII